jgi:hypothetical protein
MRKNPQRKVAGSRGENPVTQSEPSNVMRRANSSGGAVVDITTSVGPLGSPPAPTTGISERVNTPPASPTGKPFDEEDPEPKRNPLEIPSWEEEIKRRIRQFE